jgi:Fur family peroxide stress response transcriptional regulator
VKEKGPHTPLSVLKEALSGAGLKATQQRLVIYQCLMASDNHPTAEEIFELVRPDNPSISLGTVYKTLETLVESQLAQKVPVSENKMRYDARMEAHHHIYCTNTGEIIDFQDKELESIIRNYLEAKQIKNLSVQNFNLQIRGSKTSPEQDVTIK